MKLNEIRDNEGATKNRMRVGRGIGSGKGKTGGRGVQGSEGPYRRGHQGLRRRPDAAASSPAEARLQQRRTRRELNEVNLGRIQQAVEAGKLDTGAAVTVEALVAAGVVSKPRDGVKILGVGELKAKLSFQVARRVEVGRRGDREGRRLGHPRWVPLRQA